MKCLVTGGAGFIGSHLCDALIQRGDQVICVDNLLTGNKKNIEHLLPNQLFSFLEADCAFPLTEIKAEIIFHFASPASPPKYQKYSIETLLVNTIGTYHLLNQARAANARFVYASTSEIYGDPLEHPQKESYWGNVNPIGPRACYDEAKRVGETFVAEYHRKFNLDTRIIRIFNTFGPRMDIDDGRVITNFIQQILNETPLTIYGNGAQTRSFCYVSDLVEGIVALGTKDDLDGAVINVGNPNETSIKEFASLICNLVGVEPRFEYQDLPQDDPMQRKPDISQARKLLGWAPKVSLEAGLKSTFAYFRKKTQ